MSVGLACGGGAADEGESSGSEDETTAETTADESATSAETGETGGESLFDGELEVKTYGEQPMVADVTVHLRAGAELAELALAHPLDPGVKISPLAAESSELTRVYRMRGLAPATVHGVEVDASLDGEADTLMATFTAPAPLPGFPGSFEVTVSGEPETAYRLMDWSNFGGPDAEPVGLMQLDSEGVVRWYMGVAETPIPGPAATMAGVQYLDDGTVLFQQNGSNFIIDEFGSVVAQFDPEKAGHLFHHDVVRLPNGNILAMGFSFQDVDYGGSEGVLHVAGDSLTEFAPDGEVVWRWDTFDHMDPQRRREGFDTVFPPIYDPDTGELCKDWTHGNGLHYIAEDDSILMSFRHQDWVIKIDHSTGDIVWRFGEEGDFTLGDGTWFYHQHSPQLQSDGSILLYDNANDNPNLPEADWQSRAVRYEIDETNKTATQVWEDDEAAFMSEAMGDADRMPGGHILVTDSAIGLNISGDMIHARVRELDPEASPQKVWEFTTVMGRFIYRAVPTNRLVGETGE